MDKVKLACFMAFLSLVVAMFCGLIGQSVMAQTSGQTSEEKIELNVQYPIRPGSADITFDFNVDLQYSGGNKPRTFELSATGPRDWAMQILDSSGQKQISAISLDPSKTYPDTVLVVVGAPYWLSPEPGDYTIKFKAASGNITSSFDLVARITARYGFSVATETGQLNIKATAGKESRLGIAITNSGTAALKQITFSSTKPTGIANEQWSVTFKPDKIENLNPGDKRELEAVIKPPSKTIAGDYMTTLEFNSDQVTTTQPPSLEIRVTVSTPTKWGWIGAGIVLAVIAGLVVAFRRLGRR